ncbi:MAG: cob(I)yrinic acid a,c-diamide adenosyltransferase [Candidatus Dormibacteria bacterium]
MDPNLKKNRRGITLVFTGDGKGKTTAAMGLALRAAGNHLEVRIIQFIKGSWKTGERTAFIDLIPQVDISADGRGFTVDHLRDPSVTREEHEEAGRNAWALAVEAVRSSRYRMVVLDEILGSINAGLVPLEEAVDLIRTKPRELHLVLTGRNAPAEIVEAADCVTEMLPIKHHYRGAGIPAQRGIEF